MQADSQVRYYLPPISREGLKMPVKSNVKIATLGYVIVYVKDTKKAVPFYKDILGMQPKMEEDGWVEFETGAATFALHDDKKLTGERAHGEGQPLPVFNVEDFDGTVKALKESGVKFDHDPMQVCEAGPGQVGMSVQFRDPEGNALSIFGLVKK
jgi:lactoylglutathione lyase